MITQEQIEKIIQESVNAPSGDNSQPWHFRVRGNALDIMSIDRDKTIFNFLSRGDYIAHGALIENMGIVGAELGYQINVALFPDSSEGGVTARVVFEEREGNKDQLYSVIQKRVTNRKPYKKKELSADQKKALVVLNGHYSSATVTIIDSREGVSRIANAVNLNERLILENKTIRDFLFSIIRWTKKEEQEKPGMHIRTLELALPQRLAFRMFKHDVIALIAKKLGFPRLMEKEGATTYEASGAMGVITIGGGDAKEFVNAGRLLERVWMTATKNGLSVQPLAAIPYLAQRIKEGDTTGISEKQSKDVLSAEKRLRNTFGISDQRIIAMLFRIGEGESPTARAVKLAPVIEWLQ